MRWTACELDPLSYQIEIETATSLAAEQQIAYIDRLDTFFVGRSLGFARDN